MTDERTAAQSQPPVAGATRTGRLGYLDWLRGAAVLVMVEAHVFDAWTRPEDKGGPVYGWLMMLGGMGAPLFLFLAGVAVSLAAASHARRGVPLREASRRVRVRGWQIFGYAFLLRLQSFVLGGFHAPVSLLKVDVLNIMGPSIVATAALWSLALTRRRRAALLAAAAALVALTTPPIRGTPWIAWLPDPLEWYVRPSAGHTNFTLFPWGGFVLAGGVLGLGLEGASGRWSAARVQGAILLTGGGLLAGCWWASLQPSLYESAGFWTSSPAFFGLRVGLLLLAVAGSWAWSARPWRHPARTSPLEVLGIGSLFVYWVHLELVYGIFGLPLRARQPIERTAVAFLVLCGLMYGLLALWNRSRPARTRFWETLITRDVRTS